jgi:hypothetical protein
MVGKYQEVYVDLEDFDTADLIEELENRDEYVPFDTKELVEKIWHNRRNGLEYDSLVDKLIYDVLGKVI